MDKAIKRVKRSVGEKMDKLVSMDKKRDKKCDSYKMKAKKKRK